MSDDETWMRLAIEQAQQGVGKTAPNPPVGSVIVKNGILLGKGWHRGAGRPHAEREAMADARERHGDETLRGATAYVTLEPCSTHGRTPPCVDGLIEAGIFRVVYACVDPNPAHVGRADERLARAGIEVTSGVLASEAEKILRPFSKVQRTGLPWVMVKMAMSLDGRISRPEGEGPWLTSAEARSDVQRLRAQCDAIMTTGATVRADWPALTIREPELCEGRPQPWRVIMTGHPETMPLQAPVMSDEHRERTLIRGGDVEKVLRELVIEQGVLAVMVEAGGEFVAELLRLRLVDEWVCYLAPMMTGGKVAVAGESDLSICWVDAEWKRLGNDVRVRARVAPVISDEGHDYSGK
jgi:diaminohydroxyphosphoribosylaminopyrimidine deaminase/5-amino-6-(5-phosphoribosylamino)uracil reductase